MGEGGGKVRGGAGAEGDKGGANPHASVEPARREGAADATVGGIAPGDHWVDPGGNECVVTWVRKLGVLAYRRVGDRMKNDQVVDVVRFIQRFRPAHIALSAKHAGGTG